jgi:hypothetical protein
MSRSTSFADSIFNNLASLPDQTNLALKGVIGIGAMSKIAEAVKQPEDQKYYSVWSFMTSFFDKLILTLFRKWPRITLRNGNRWRSIREDLSMLLVHQTPAFFTTCSQMDYSVLI